jgi:hypothetical protein
VRADATRLFDEFRTWFAGRDDRATGDEFHGC